MANTIGFICAGITLVLLMVLDSTYNKKRKAAFPTAELDKFNKE